MTINVAVARPRAWYHGWNIVGTCILLQVAANGLVISSFSLFLRDWSADLRSPISSLQVAFVAIGLMNGLAAVPVGILVDRYPIRWLLFGGVLMMGLAEFAVSYVTATWQLLLLYALPIPFSVSIATVPANAVVSRWFVRRRGLALGLTALGLAMAGIILPPIIASVMPSHGWRMIWRTAGLVTALVINPIVLWVVRDRPTERDGLYYLTGEADGVPPAQHDHGHSGGVSDLTWREVFRRRNFWILVAVYLPITALYGVGLSNLAPIAATRGVSQQTAGLMLAFFSIAQAVATVVMGVLSDRFGNRMPLSGLAFATAAGGLTIAFGPNAASLGLGVILIGLGGGQWPLLAAAIALEFGSAGFGRAFGLLFGFLPLIVLTPFLTAKIQEITGSYVPSLIGLTAITVAGGTACFIALRERRV